MGSGDGPPWRVGEASAHGSSGACLRVALVAGRFYFCLSSGPTPAPLFVVSLDWYGPTAGSTLTIHFDSLLGPGIVSSGSSSPGLGARPGGAPALLPVSSVEPARTSVVRSSGAGAPLPSAPSLCGVRCLLGVAADDFGAAPAVGSQTGAPSKRGGFSVPRKSPRLALRPRVHVLDLAMARKAALRDDSPLAAAGLDDRADPERRVVGTALVSAGLGGGGVHAPGSEGFRTAAAPSVNRRIADLSATCGVLLFDDEACRFTSSLRSAAAEV